jgi:hypothetical protein
MGVDHGGADIGVAKQFLHRTDVGAGLQKMGGERVTQGMNRHLNVLRLRWAACQRNYAPVPL